MPFGAPDFGNIQKISTLHRLDDMAELAVRLGSTYIWDRQGDVIHVDPHIYAPGIYHVYGNIENVEVKTSIPWPSHMGPGTLVVFKTAGTDYFHIRKTLPFVRSQTIGLTSFLSRTSNTGSLIIYIRCVVDERDNRPGIEFRRNGDYYDIYVFNTNNKIGSVPFRVFSYYSVTFIKFVVDFYKNVIGRVVVGSYVFRPNAPFSWLSAPPGEAYIGWDYRIYNDPTLGERLFLQQTIITINEVV